MVFDPQVQQLEEEQRSREEQEARAQKLGRWIRDQSRWMESARTPSSRAELRRSLAVCQVRGQRSRRDQTKLLGSERHSSVSVFLQDLKEKMEQKSAALQQLRDAEKILEAFEALTPQVTHPSSSIFLRLPPSSSIFLHLVLKSEGQTLRPGHVLTSGLLLSLHQSEQLQRQLVQTLQRWESVDEQLERLNADALRTAQTLRHLDGPRISLQAQRHVHQQLQVRAEQPGPSCATSWMVQEKEIGRLNGVKCRYGDVMLFPVGGGHVFC